MIAIEKLAAVFVEVADTLVVDFDIVDFLQMVTTRSADMTRAQAAGLVLANERNQLQFMAASQESVKLLELFQLQAEEGPCLDCFRFGAAVANADLARAAERWPRFAPEAVRAGYRAVHAFPLRHRNKVIGALNLFSTSEGRIDANDGKVIQALADVATIGLLQQRAIAHGEILTEQLQVALALPRLHRAGQGSARADAQGVRGRGVHPDADARPPEPPQAHRPGPRRHPRPGQPAGADRR